MGWDDWLRTEKGDDWFLKKGLFKGLRKDCESLVSLLKLENVFEQNFDGIKFFKLFMLSLIYYFLMNAWSD